MKRALGILFLVFIFLISCRESNDLLSRIFSRAFKSKQPLVTQTDNIWQPLVGYYLLENERVVKISKKDAKTYQVYFYPASINGSDMNNTATTCMVGNTRFFNLLSYQNNFLFFKVGSLNDSTYSLDFVSTSVKRIIGDTATGPDFRKWWLKNASSLEDKDDLFDSYRLEKQSEKEALAYQKRQIRNSVYSMSDFEKYASLYPDEMDLANFKQAVLQKNIDRCSSISCIHDLVEDYPEITNEGIVKAKSLCTSTAACIKFVEVFPTDTASERIKSKAFSQASTSEEIERLVNAFPSDKRTDEIRVKLLLTKAEECQSDEDYTKLMETYARDDKALRIINTVKVFNQITPNGKPFNVGSHVLTADGKKAMDKIVDFLNMANQQDKIITDVYFGISSADGTDSLPTEPAFTLAMNRCVAIKKYLAGKKITSVNWHFIPVGNGLKASTLMNPQLSFSSFEKRLRPHKEVYRKWCFSSGQTLIIPDPSYEFKNENWMNEDAYIALIKQRVLAYLNTYKKGSEVTAIVPVHLWDETQAADKSVVANLKQEIQPAAKKAGISKKTLPKLGFTLQ